jgi:hypothetical protein
MGLGGSVPEATENQKKAIALLNLTPSEVRSFYAIFRKLDKEKKGYSL